MIISIEKYESRELTRDKDILLFYSLPDRSVLHGKNKHNTMVFLASLFIISNQGLTQMDLEQAQSHEHIFPQLAWPGRHHVH